MINYSITQRAVNTNLLEINQAKARVNKAKEAGVAPDPADEALANTELVTKAYAIAQYSDVLTIEKLAKHIASHGCVYSRADITAILNMTVDCVREELLDGKKIRLGDLGDFSLSLQSKGAESAKDFSAQNITGVSVVWDCGQEFKNLIADAEFNLVASRSAQAAVLKAIKKGETTVDLTGGSDDDNPDGGGDNTPKKYTISVTSANNAQGTVSGGGTFNEGASATITATPKSGYQFDKWSDGNTQSSRIINVSKDLTLTASFKAVNSGGSESDGSGEEGGGTDSDNTGSGGGGYEFT